MHGMKLSPIPGRRGERGNALIEFSLSALVLTTMFVFCFQFGYAFYVYSKLQTAVRNGGRYASIRTYYSGNSASMDAYKDAVKNMVVFGDPDGVGTAVVPGLTPAAITVNITDSLGTEAGVSGGGKSVTYTKPYKVQVYVSDYALDAIFRTYTFSSKPYENFPYVGIWQATVTEP